MPNENDAVAVVDADAVTADPTDVVTDETAPEPETVSQPIAFVRMCIGDSTKGEKTLTPIGRLANMAANVKGEGAAHFRTALHFLAQGGIDQQLPGGKSLRDILTTGANTFKAIELLNIEGVAKSE